MKSKKLLYSLRIAAAIVTVSSIYIFAPWKQALYYLSPYPETYQGVINESVEQGLDGGILYIHSKGKAPLLYAAGWHDRKNQIPAFPEALFKIASISKLYDAAAVAKLAAAEIISLDAPLSRYLPEYAQRIENANSITLRMLVQHRSGIPNFTDHPKFNWGESSLDAVSLILDMPADFAPGEDYAYSNSNYVLLQLIMSAALGYDYKQFMSESILVPLGLSQTYFSIHEIDMSKLMSGYYVGYDDDFKHLDQGYVASASDVGVFLRALNDGTLFDEKAREIYASLYEFEHTGWVLGYTSIARFHADTDTVIVLLINTTGNETILFRDIMYARVLALLEEQY